MKKVSLILLLCIAVIGLLYAAFKEQGWQYNQQERMSIYEKDYPNLESVERALKLLKESQYAAIVYPERTMVHANSWFSRNILGPEHWESATTAKVLHTIRGDEYSSIEYGSLAPNLSNHAIFVGLCVKTGSEGDWFLTPDNGFEIPATEELIQYFKNTNVEELPAYASESCP